MGWGAKYPIEQPEGTRNVKRESGNVGGSLAELVEQDFKVRAATRMVATAVWSDNLKVVLAKGVKWRESVLEQPSDKMVALRDYDTSAQIGPKLNL